MTDETFEHQDDDESYCEGDVPIEDIDPADLQHVADTLDDPDDPTAALEKLYGSRLVIP